MSYYSDPLGRPQARVEDAWLKVMRIKSGWEKEKEFRTTFERFVFDMGLEPAVAEARTLEVIRILEAHEYKEPA